MNVPGAQIDFAADADKMQKAAKGADRNARRTAMDTHPVKIPGPDHPISIEPSHARVIVTVAGETIADSRNALTLREGSYPPVHYIPRADVDMALLARSTRTSHCPYKGQASHYSIPIGGDRARDAIWTYEDAYPAVAAINGYMAFYPDRVDALDVQPA